MKTSYSLLAIVTILLSLSCSMIECEQIEKRHAFILIDISDKDLFKKAKSDLQENFGGFMHRNAIGKISPCEKFSLSIAPVSGQETLDISTKSIEIERRGLSREQERQLANPRPLVQLLKKKLDEYNQLSDDPVITSSTSIVNVLLKSMNQADLASENIFLLMSDGVANNAQLNLYNGIPEEAAFSEIIERLIEPSVLEKYRQKYQKGLQAKVIMVLKNEPAGKVDRRKIKAFWIAIFEELELNYQFIDNLSNKVNLQ